MSNRRRLHQSEVQAYLKCGLMWQYRYVDGLKMPPKAALTLGSAVDAAVTKNLQQKIESNLDMPTEAVLDAFSSDFDTRAKETEWDPDEDAGKEKDKGVQMVRAHHEHAAPKIQPETVQESFVIETDAGYDLGGTIDLVEKSGVIADTKTAKAAYAENAIERAMQPALYDFAYEALRGKPAEGFRYDVLVKPTAKKPAEYKPVAGKVTAEDREFLFLTINNVHKAMEAGIAMPAPEAPGVWWCSRGWCGYAAICPKFKGRK